MKKLEEKLNFILLPKINENEKIKRKIENRKKEGDKKISFYIIG
jgi:hypothetical protein